MFLFYNPKAAIYSLISIIQNSAVELLAVMSLSKPQVPAVQACRFTPRRFAVENYAPVRL